jgi:hypothetical protein
MRTGILAMGLTMVMAASVNAQEYKLAKSSGRLELRELNNVTIEGTTGNEIIFSSLDNSDGRDERSKGLRAVSSMGLEDNTGIGLSVTDKGSAIEVYQLKKMDGPRVKILVPRGVTVSYTHTSPHGNDVKFRNVEGEIEVSTVHNGVHLVNVTGPMKVRTVHGEIEVDFSANIKSPVVISSNHGPVDVTIPAATKANLLLSTNHGEIFVDPAIKIEFDKQGDWKVYGSNKVNGKINGGGLDFTLSSDHNSIYLRKK